MHATTSVSPRSAASSERDATFEEKLGAIDTRLRLVVRPDRTVTYCHAAHAALLVAPSPLLLTESGKLVADNRAADIALARLIGEAGQIESRLHLAAARRRHWALLTAWAPSMHEVYVLASLSLPHRSVTASGLAKLLQLTHAEARVLDQFAALRRPKEIAERLGVTLSTVRTHIKQIRAKSGTGSAVELAQMVRCYAAG